MAEHGLCVITGSDNFISKAVAENAAMTRQPLKYHIASFFDSVIVDFYYVWNQMLIILMTQCCLQALKGGFRNHWTLLILWWSLFSRLNSGKKGDKFWSCGHRHMWCQNFGWVQTRQNNSGCGIGRSQQTARININMVHIYFVQKLESKLL